MHESESKAVEASRSKDRLVLFITDKGFLVPTIFAALQIRKQDKVMSIADILILLIDFSEAEIEDLRRSFEDATLSFKPIPSSLYDLPAGVHFNATGVPVSTLARLSIGGLIPERYEHVTYLDGDIQVVGDILPLVAHSVAPGHLAAGNEAIWLSAGTPTRFWRRNKPYIEGLGIGNPVDYFNAGVLLFRRTSWIDISARAKAFFLENSRLCKFHDQSALNFACKGRREVLSPVWNFTSDYGDIGMQREMEPRILHFTGPRKPWFYAGPPWMGRFMAGYDQVVASHPVLAPYRRSPPPERIASMQASFANRNVLHKAFTGAQNLIRRNRFRRFMRQTKFAVS